jgi:hypothetical protein
MGAMTSPVPQIAIQPGSAVLEFNSYRLNGEGTAATSWKQADEVWSWVFAHLPATLHYAESGSLQTVRTLHSCQSKQESERDNPQ